LGGGNGNNTAAVNGNVRRYKPPVHEGHHTADRSLQGASSLSSGGRGREKTAPAAGRRVEAAPRAVRSDPSRAILPASRTELKIIWFGRHFNRAGGDCQLQECESPNFITGVIPRDRVVMGTVLLTTYSLSVEVVNRTVPMTLRPHDTRASRSQSFRATRSQSFRASPLQRLTRQYGGTLNCNIQRTVLCLFYSPITSVRCF
jgi:hypothetical protein